MMLLPVKTYGFSLLYDTWYLAMTAWYGYQAFNFVSTMDWESTQLEDWWNVTHNSALAAMRLFIWTDKVFNLAII
jgi:hypothetical protein